MDYADKLPPSPWYIFAPPPRYIFPPPLTERLTGALLDRLTHHVNILEMNGDSYRLSQSRARRNSADS